MDISIVEVGLEYGFGVANVGHSQLFVAPGDVGILPGVTLKADDGYNTEDLNGRDDPIVEQDNAIPEQDNTVVGVVPVQMDY